VEHPTTIAVDLAKSVFEVAVSNEPCRVCERKRLTRSQMAAFFANLTAARVLMEACGASPSALRAWKAGLEARLA
jgi:transposase